MTELVGRFLSFEDRMGHGLVTFGYYLLLFLLVVTTLYDMILAFAGFFGSGFFRSLGKFFVLIPVQFIVMLIGLRVATEFVLAVLGIEEGLKSEPLDTDVLSSGLNPVRQPSQMASAPTAERETPEPAEEETEPPAKTTKKRTRKAAKKPTTKKTAQKAAPEPANDPSSEKDTPTSDDD